MTSTALPGHPHIAYRHNELFVEDVRVSDLAQAHGTPLFVYSTASMREALAAYQRGFAGRKLHICYAMKANSSLAMLQFFARQGCGFDIVSGGELERVLAAGGDPAKVIFSGVGKTRAEMRQALQAGILCFNVESEAELEVLSEVATAAGQTAPVSIRVNPNVDPKTHPYISTGLKGNKFGVAHERTLATYQRAAALPGLRVVGIDFHIGSQITEATPTSMPPTVCWTWSRPSKRRAFRSTTSTLAAALASITTATPRRPPMPCGSNSWPRSTPGVLATGSS